MTVIKLFELGLAVLVVSHIAASSFAIAPSGPILAQSYGLEGLVSDSIGGGKLGRARVVVQGNGTRFEVLTGVEGSYRIDVPSGNYKIAVTKPGFCPARRATIRVSSTSDAIFNFALVPCPIVNRLIIKDGKYLGETDGYEPPFRYDAFSNAPPFSGTLDLLVRFGERKENEDTITYSGSMVSYLVDVGDVKNPSQEHKYLGVMVSYDQLTLYADKVTLSKRGFQLEANGNVVAQDGRQVRVGKHATVTFEAGQHFLRLSQ